MSFETSVKNMERRDKVFLIKECCSMNVSKYVFLGLMGSVLTQDFGICNRAFFGGIYNSKRDLVNSFDGPDAKVASATGVVNALILDFNGKRASFSTDLKAEISTISDDLINETLAYYAICSSWAGRQRWGGVAGMASGVKFLKDLAAKFSSTGRYVSGKDGFEILGLIETKSALQSAWSAALALKANDLAGFLQNFYEKVAEIPMARSLSHNGKTYVIDYGTPADNAFIDAQIKLCSALDLDEAVCVAIVGQLCSNEGWRDSCDAKVRVLINTVNDFYITKFGGQKIALGSFVFGVPMAAPVGSGVAAIMSFIRAMRGATSTSADDVTAECIASCANFMNGKIGLYAVVSAIQKYCEGQLNGNKAGVSADETYSGTTAYADLLKELLDWVWANGNAVTTILDLSSGKK
jgi:hypothetical protein